MPWPDFCGKNLLKKVKSDSSSAMTWFLWKESSEKKWSQVLQVPWPDFCGKNLLKKSEVRFFKCHDTFLYNFYNEQYFLSFYLRILQSWSNQWHHCWMCLPGGSFKRLRFTWGGHFWSHFGRFVSSQTSQIAGQVIFELIPKIVGFERCDLLKVGFSKGI